MQVLSFHLYHHMESASWKTKLTRRKADLGVEREKDRLNHTEPLDPAITEGHIYAGPLS